MLIALAAVSTAIVVALIAAPQQVAEAVSAARDLVCSGCVDTTDIQNFDSSKAGTGIQTSDIADNAVTGDKIPSGAIGTQELAPGSVTSLNIQNYDTSKGADGIKTEDLGDQSATTAKIKDGTITSDDMAPGTIPSNPPSTLLRTIKSDSVVVHPGPARNGVSVSCDTGYVVIGGGFSLDQDVDGITVVTNAPLSATTWDVQAFNNSPIDINLNGYAVCAKVG